MAKKPSKQSAPKEGASPGLSVPSVAVHQGGITLLMFALKASQLWNIAAIARRDDKEKVGYQRILLMSRVEAIAQYIVDGNVIPGAIIVALDNAVFDVETNLVTIPKGKDVAWVIDGQHRLAAAHEAAERGHDIELPVVAFVHIEQQEQIRQFVTINREAKGVPTSLVLDLLPHLQKTNPNELARERAAQIANDLRSRDDSPFKSRIAIVDAPRSGQISLANFVRKLMPLVHPERGRLRNYSFIEQTGIIDNYFAAVRTVFWDEWKLTNSVFFQTIGFGGLINCLPDIIDLTLASRGGKFRVEDVAALLGNVESFDFAQWRQYGSGNKAEMAAADALRTELNASLKSKRGSKAAITLS